MNAMQLFYWAKTGRQSSAPLKKELDAIIDAVVRLGSRPIDPGYAMNVCIIEKAVLRGDYISTPALAHFLANYQSIMGKPLMTKKFAITIGTPKGHRWKPFRLEKGETRDRFYSRTNRFKAEYARNRLEEHITSMSPADQQRYAENGGMNIFTAMNEMKDDIASLRRDIADLRSERRAASDDEGLSENGHDRGSVLARGDSYEAADRDDMVVH
jgi:hypothetical protein